MTFNIGDNYNLKKKKKKRIMEEMNKRNSMPKEVLI